MTPLREHRRAYLLMNLVFYGLVLVGMAIAAAVPSRAARLAGDGPLGTALRAVTVAQLQRVVTEYLEAGRRTSLELRPDGR